MFRLVSTLLFLGLVLLTMTGCMTPSLFPKTSPLQEVVLSGEGRDKSFADRDFRGFDLGQTERCA